MFHVAFPRGQGPAFADLPPTLQPGAVLSAAPPVDHFRSAAGAAVVYALIGLSAFAFSRQHPTLQTPPLVPPVTRPEIEYVRLPRIVIARTSPAPATGGGRSEVPAVQTPAVAPPVDSDAPAAHLPAIDRTGESPNPHSGSTSQVGPVTSAATVGPMVHDFSMIGLAVLHQVDPIYPEFARRARIQGPVVLMMTVDERGQPIQVQVLEGHPVFHGAAMQAARQWRFEPARMDGRPVAAAFRLTLKFSLR